MIEAICKIQNGELENGMREMQRARPEMRGMDGNAGARNQRRIWAQMRQSRGIRAAMQGIKVELKYSGRNDIE